MKSLTPNDPDFTAKVLGENIENEVSADALDEFDELKDFANEIKKSVKEHSRKDNDKLSDASRDKIKQSKVRILTFPTWIGTIAALFIFMLIIQGINREQLKSIIKDTGSQTSDHYSIITNSPAPTEVKPSKKQPLHPKQNNTEATSQNPLFQKEVKLDHVASSNQSVARIKSIKTQGLMKELTATNKMTGMLSVPLGGNPLNEDFDREGYDYVNENNFLSPLDHPLSTFSIDVDTASYSNVRRMLKNNQLPRSDAIRIEEFINYFKYDYPAPEEGNAFNVILDATICPWNPDHQLIRVAIKGKEMNFESRQPANLVFLIDVSGSMNRPNKLPLVKKSLTHLIRKMNKDDRIAIVVYAGASGLALPSTTANNHETIQHALDNLSAGGSTNGSAGIELAYKTALKHYNKDGINRVILCTDGDFNVGTSDNGSLQRLIQKKAQTGIFFSAIGFGSGNYQDSTMEILSNNGNGNYAYIDTENEARRVFAENLLGTLYTIAKDVKIQVEFNPNVVNSYRLIGYENRLLSKEDFNNDQKDAGDIGAGHTVTALYEIAPQKKAQSVEKVDPLRYQKPREVFVENDEIMTLKIRYKQTEESKSKLLVNHLKSEDIQTHPDRDLKLATVIAAFAMHMQESSHLNGYRIEEIQKQIRDIGLSTKEAEVLELIELIEIYSNLKKNQKMKKN